MLRNTVHPGEFLQEILEERGISQSRLAKHIGVESGVINLICKGKRGISASMAKKLARALGTDSELWLNLQSSYDLTRAEDPEFGKIRA
ncbi:MAG: HigA family addiction module antidote protein [Proteobacteria bacterium]|nr:HigA family addiction module antidote protein [Pseudomonadota bacterium]